ncbi:conjugal transfer protein TrbC [Chitinimonas arctica]|uniref:Conjugal transfer protein TrbC n=1 Tax=Chitinimonas arctica TaxID=2594795 RepID=A0A516SHP9_9NEIS|nr:TrbC/VirB2 family protein [Chitinimonas arctica]QDQ27578.1 conjugal transfer protein TrbC [Chitinimonas arctica]
MRIPAHRIARISIIVTIVALPLFAAAAGLPWEGPLNKLKDSLTGPVAKAIGVIALAVAGGMLAFGGELGDFTKRIMMVIMALSVMLLANNFMSMFGA